MGLFSSKKETHVASVAYNMAGDELDRPQYLKSVVVQNVLSDSSQSIVESLNSSLLNGPAIKFRNFFNWAENNYTILGYPTGTLGAGSSLSTSLVQPHIPAPSGTSIWVQDASLGSADYGRWIEKYLIENRPDAIETEWTADIDENTSVITITFEDNTTYSFTPVDFDPASQYIFAYYNEITTNQEGPITLGPIIPLGSAPFPSVVGWTLVSNTPSTAPVTLVTVVETLREYSDERPDEEDTSTSSVPGTINRNTGYYTLLDYEGTVPGSEDAVSSSRNHMWLYTDQTVSQTVVTTETEEEVEPGVTVKITETTTTDGLVPANSYRTGSQDIINQAWSPLKMFIYQIGSGVTDLDNLVSVVENYGRFFPYIPVRLDNKFISDDYLPNLYKEAKRGYKKATNGKFDELVDELAENDDLGNIDFAFITFGVSINVLENASKKYIYNLLKNMMASQAGGPLFYDWWYSQVAAYDAAFIEWDRWRKGQDQRGSPYYGRPAPALPVKPTMPVNQIRIADSGSVNTHYDQRINWSYVVESTGTGRAKPDAKKGDLWFTYIGKEDLAASIYMRDGDDRDKGFRIFKSNVDITEKIRLYWQVSENSYTYLDIVGLVHYNFVYNGKAVTTTGKAGIEDAEESGFIFPLHYATYKSMSLVDTTQMSTACVFIVFNCYQIVKRKWYQRGIFRVVLSIVIAVIAVVIAGPAGGAGILGSNAALGAAVGLTGLSGAIAGAIANAVAAMVLIAVVERVSVGLFGEKWGRLIGAILSFISIQSLTNFQVNGSFSFWNDMTKVDNLLRLTDAVGKGYVGYIQGRIMEISSEMESNQTENDKEMKRVRDAYIQQFGYGNANIDPLMFIDTSPIMAESRDTFLTRTLMTGSEIADMTHGLISEFADLNLSLPGAFT